MGGDRNVKQSEKKREEGEGGVMEEGRKEPRL